MTAQRNERILRRMRAWLRKYPPNHSRNWTSNAWKEMMEDRKTSHVE